MVQAQGGAGKEVATAVRDEGPAIVFYEMDAGPVVGSEKQRIESV